MCSGISQFYQSLTNNVCYYIIENWLVFAFRWLKFYITPVRSTLLFGLKWVIANAGILHFGYPIIVFTDIKSMQIMNISCA